MSYTTLIYHIVYATKERAPLITEVLRPQYVRDQEKHHRRQSFEAEFKALLKAHRIEFKEAYLWS